MLIEELRKELSVVLDGQHVMMDCGREEFFDMELNPVIDTNEVIGYVLKPVVHYNDPRQLFLPFEG